MATILQILKNDLNTREQNERKVGRYHASEIQKILSGEITPENFFEKKEFDEKASWNIAWGEILEEGLTERFKKAKVKCQYQVKKEIKINGFVIVCKADFLFKDFVLELKVPLRERKSISKFHYPQLECYFRAWKKPVKILYFSRNGYKVFDYQPDEELWERIKEKVGVFHQKLTN